MVLLAIVVFKLLNSHLVCPIEEHMLTVLLRNRPTCCTVRRGGTLTTDIASSNPGGGMGMLR